MEWLDRVSLTYSVQHLTSETGICDQFFFMKIVLGCYIDVGWSTTKIQEFFRLLWYYYQLKYLKQPI
jgi:hypothetical protein